VFFARSDWLLNLGIISAIQLPAFSGFSAGVFPHFLEKQKELFATGYPLIWYALKQLFSVGEECRCTKTIIHLSVGE